MIQQLWQLLCGIRLDMINLLFNYCTLLLALQQNQLTFLKDYGCLQFIENNYRISVPIKELFNYPAFQKECKINYEKYKKFGLLEIKALKCGAVKSLNEPGKAAYLQVRDISDNQNNKVFVFNGWMFSSK